MLEEKRRRGWSYRRFAAELAKHQGVTVSHGALHKLLTSDGAGHEKQQSSSFAAAISALFGVPLPTVDNPELSGDPVPREAELLRAFRKRSREEQEAILLLLESLR